MVVFGFSSSEILEEGVCTIGGGVFEIILVTGGTGVEVVEVDLVVLLIISLNFFPFKMVTLAVVIGIELGVEVVVDLALPVWVGRLILVVVFGLGVVVVIIFALPVLMVGRRAGLL